MIILSQVQNWPNSIQTNFVILSEQLDLIGTCDIETTNHIYIKGFYIEESMRSKGYGKLLFNKVLLECLRIQKLNKDYPITLMTEHDNIIIPYYQKKGFEIMTLDEDSSGYEDVQNGFVWMEYKNKK